MHLGIRTLEMYAMPQMGSAIREDSPPYPGEPDAFLSA